MNLDTKGKGGLVYDWCANTVVFVIRNIFFDYIISAAIGNVFFEASHTKVKVTLVVFYHDISKKFILIGASTTLI